MIFIPAKRNSNAKTNTGLFYRITLSLLWETADNLESGVTEPKLSLVEIKIASKGSQKNKILSLP